MIADALLLLSLTLSMKTEWNYQLSAMKEAFDCLLEDDVPGAVHALGDAVDHANRDGWTEDRPEAVHCLALFRLLTNPANKSEDAA